MCWPTRTLNREAQLSCIRKFSIPIAFGRHFCSFRSFAHIDSICVRNLEFRSFRSYYEKKYFISESLVALGSLLASSSGDSPVISFYEEPWRWWRAGCTGLLVFPVRAWSAWREAGAVVYANVGLQNLSISCRMSVTGGVGRRSALMAVKARRASSGDLTDKQREEKRSIENIPSSPPPPSTSANSVGVREENESIETGTVSEAVVDDQLAARASSGDGGISGSQNSEGKGEENSTSSPEGSSDEIGKEISELRRERAAMGLQDPASTTDFWRGVAEETRLVDWPVFSKVLGTTGVVVAMILGSSVVLLTVNAILAASSDFVFHEHAVRELVATQ